MGGYNPYAIDYINGRPTHYRLDDNHQPVPCSWIEWAEMFEDIRKRRVAYTDVGDCRVSTVFLGIDHSRSDGPPILFETMVFGMPTDKLNLLGVPETATSPLGEEPMDRYETWAEALMGHKRFVDRLRSALTKIDRLMSALSEAPTVKGDDPP